MSLILHSEHKILAHFFAFYIHCRCACERVVSFLYNKSINQLQLNDVSYSKYYFQ